MLRRILPHPLLTLLLALVWMLLENAWSAGVLVFGLFLGIVIPIVTVGLLAGPAAARRPVAAWPPTS